MQEKNKQEVIDTNGEEVITKGYDKITQIANSGVVYTKNGKYGLIGYDGKVKINAKYEDLKEINTDIFIAKKDKKYGIVDLKDNKKVDFKYANIYYDKTAGIYVAEDKKYQASIMDTDFKVQVKGILSELNTDNGYMKVKVGDGYKYYNFKFEEKNAEEVETTKTLYLSKKDDKYGFVNKDGYVVVDYIYDDATEQNDYGYAAVKKDNLWGSIDSEGKVVIEPTYNLDKNLIIDFIGKWHLGQDINMNYYCEK